jgi:hypothetical protein
MAPMGKHEMDEFAPNVTLAAPDGPRRDHLWVLAVIAACALAEVWPSWVGLGSASGFPKLGSMPTDWVLAVVMEAYWAYTLYAWLAASPGPRSRAFAMWSCGVVFVLSLVGQVTYHEMTLPPGTGDGERASAAFVTILPVTVLAMIAVLIHLRHADREAKAAKARAAARAERMAATERAEADERAHLRRELDAVTARTETEITALRGVATGAEAEAETARAEAEALAGEVQSLTRKLAEIRERQKAGSRGGKQAGSGRRNRPGNAAATGAQAPAATGPEDAPGSGAEVPPSDLDAEALVLWHVDKGKSASAAGILAGLSDSRGRQIVRDLAKKAPRGVDAAGTEA